MMLQRESMVKIVDNTGATLGLIIGISKKGTHVNNAIVGDIVVVAIKEASSSSSISIGDVRRAIVVRTVKEVQRKDGTAIRSSDNAVVLIDEDGKPLGKRVFGPVFGELRDRGYKNVTTMAQEII